MADQYSRTRMLLGEDAMRALRRARVAVFGVGALDLVDDDVVSLTNLNRQLLATHDTLGRPKVDVAAERVRAIDPACAVRTYRTFFLPETAGQFDFAAWDYVVDAIDTVAGKLALVERALGAVPPGACDSEEAVRAAVGAAERAFASASTTTSTK